MKNLFFLAIIFVFHSCSDSNYKNNISSSELLFEYQNSVKNLKTFILSNEVDIISANKIIASNINNKDFCDQIQMSEIELSNELTAQYLSLLCIQMKTYENLETGFPEINDMSKEDLIDIVYKGTNISPDQARTLLSRRNNEQK